MRVNRTVIALVAVGLVAGLAGCATAAPPPSPGSTTSSPPASPEPTATRTTADPEDPSTWTISEDGIGPIEIGGDFAAVLDALPDSWEHDTENCSWAAFWNAEETTYGMHFVQGTEDPVAPIRLVSTSSTADAIDDGAGPKTVHGLGIGSTKDEVRAQHPDAEEGESPIDGTWLKIPGPGEASIYFQYAEGGDQAWGVTVTDLPEPPYEVCG